MISLCAVCGTAVQLYSTKSIYVVLAKTQCYATVI